MRPYDPAAELRIRMISMNSDQGPRDASSNAGVLHCMVQPTPGTTSNEQCSAGFCLSDQGLHYDEPPRIRHAPKAADPAERLEASEYEGPRSPEEEALVQHWVMSGAVDGERRA
jgi:hypothetical protein